MANFGAFVEIAPSVQGLVHISEIDHKHIGSPNEVLEPGQQVNVKILGIDEDNERISLSIKATLPKEMSLKVTHPQLNHILKMIMMKINQH